MERDGNNALLRENDYGHDLTAMFSTGTGWSFYLYDGLGSVVNLVGFFSGELPVSTRALRPSP